MEDEDRELILGSKRGDRTAFERLVKKYMKKAYYTVLGFVGDPEDALEISQDGFVRVHRNLKRFDADRRFYPWFYQILKNLSLNHLKKRRKRAEQAVPLESVGSPTGGEGLSEKEGLKETVWRAISELKDEEREIIVLKHFHGLSYKEIAEAMECPLGTVMSRLYYARRKLKEKLEPLLRP